MKDYFGYKDETVVVTGAASGMGKAATEMLVDLGAKVYALDWNEVEVEGIEKYVHVDLSNKDSIDEAFKVIPEKIDSFFGIAGVSGSKNDFMTTVSIDFIANKYITENYLYDRMSDGAIAYITSTGGNGWDDEDNIPFYKSACEAKTWDDVIEEINKTGFQYMPGTMGYPFAKLALNYYTSFINKKFNEKGIRVNALLPNATVTGMLDEFTDMAKANGQDIMNSTGNAGRLAESREMGEPVVFLNSDMASYISGEHLFVDYGQNGEEEIGVREPLLISLKGIQQMMAAHAKK